MPEQTERRALSVSNEQLEFLAERIATKIAEKTASEAVQLIKDEIYQEAGKEVISKIKWLIGISFLGFIYWLNKGGFIHIN